VIELGMVRRMIRSAAVLGPVVVVALWVWGGTDAAVSGAVGIAMALANLWLAGRIIGGVADNNPALLLVAGLLAFGLGLALLTGVALVLQAADLVSFPVTGLTLIGVHLGLVGREAARAYPLQAGARRDDASTVGS
jgi:hypothetical protein